MDSYTLFILKNISIISLPAMVLSLIFCFFFSKDKTDYNGPDINHHTTINKKITISTLLRSLVSLVVGWVKKNKKPAILILLYILVSSAAIWAKIAWLEWIILFLTFAFFCVFSAVLPIMNKPVPFIDAGWFANSIVLTLAILSTLIEKGSFQELSTNSLEQAKYIAYLLWFCFIVIYLLCLCCSYLIKLFKKKPISIRSDVSAYKVSKVAFIISVFLVYVVIIHDDYNEKVIEIYTFVAETLVIPILLLLFSSIKKKQ